WCSPTVSSSLSGPWRGSGCWWPSTPTTSPTPPTLTPDAARPWTSSQANSTTSAAAANCPPTPPTSGRWSDKQSQEPPGLPWKGRPGGSVFPQRTIHWGEIAVERGAPYENLGVTPPHSGGGRSGAGGGGHPAPGQPSQGGGGLG